MCFLKLLHEQAGTDGLLEECADAFGVELLTKAFILYYYA